MSALTKSSRGKTCSVRIPVVCNFDNSTTISAHIASVRFGHGIGKKVNDLLAADCCSSCHDVIDGRIKQNTFSREQLKFMHYSGVLETILRRFDEGLITIK